MKTRRPSRRGAAMSPVRRSTGAMCQGHPRRRSVVTLKCRRCASRRQHKTVGSSTRQAARPAREDQRMVRSRAVPSETGASEPQRSAPVKSIPREGRRSGRCPPARSMTALTAQTLTPCRGAGRGGGRRTRRRRRARHRCRSQALPRDDVDAAYPRQRSPDVHVSLVAGGSHGPTPAVAEAGGTTPRVSRGECCHC
jgi:hypothetical protein